MHATSAGSVCCTAILECLNCGKDEYTRDEYKIVWPYECLIVYSDLVYYSSIKGIFYFKSQGKNMVFKELLRTVYAKNKLAQFCMFYCSIASLYYHQIATLNSTDLTV